MASARFRAKAKERQLELDRLNTQVAQLRREKADLEAECRATRENLEREAGGGSSVHHGVDHGSFLAQT